MNPQIAKYFRPGQNYEEAAIKEAFEIANEVLNAYQRYLETEEPYARTTIAQIEEVIGCLEVWLTE